jgi:hypothetical protein
MQLRHGGKHSDQSNPGVQVDMWALGISVIEMAEVVPPRWKVRAALCHKHE